MLRLVLLALLLVTMAAPAHAGPIPGLIAAAAAWASTVTWAEVGIFLLKVAATIGLSYAAESIAGKQRKAGTGVQGVLRSGGVVPRSFIAGRYCTAGSLAYIGTWTISGQAPNAYLTYVIAVSDLPITGLVRMWVNGVAATTGTGTPTSYGYPIPEYKKAGVDYLWVKFYDGTQVVADPFLTSTFGAHPTRPYQSTRVGYGVAYVIVTARLKPDDPSFSGFPQYKFEFDGIPEYDPRTAGTAFTRNAAQHIRTILAGLTYGGAWFYGLQNFNPARLPASVWNAALNECDLAIDDANGVPEAQFTAGAEILVSTPPLEAIKEFEKACNGRVCEVAGVYEILVGAAGAAVMSFTDDDVIVTQPEKLDQFPSLNNLINTMAGSYPEPAEGYELKDAPGRTDAAFVAADGGRELVSDVQYPAVTSPGQVQRLMAAALLEARRFRTHSIVLPPTFWPVTPNNVLSWTSTRNGYAGKLFRAFGLSDMASLDVAVVLIEVDPSDYDFDPLADYLPYELVPPTLSLPASFAISSGFAVSGIIISGANGRAVAGIRISWATGVDDVSGVRYEIRRAVDAVLVLTGETDRFDRGSVDVSENIRSATNYEGREQYRPKSVRETTWTSWLPVTTPDVRLNEFDIGVNAIITAALQDNAVTAQKILAGAITLAKHATGLEPISYVAVLPNPVGYTGAKTVFLDAGTGNPKLYRYDSTVPGWTTAVASTDLLGQINTAQIADAAVTALKIAGLAVDGGKLAAGAVTVDKLNAALQLGGGNLAYNSSFEGTDVSTWWEGYGGLATLTRGGPATGLPHGSYYAYNSGNLGDNGTGIKFKTGNVAFNPNRSYVISWTSAGSGGAVGAAPGFDWNGAPPDEYTWLLGPVLAATFALTGRSAIRVKWTITPPPTLFAISYSPTNSAAHDVFFDAIQVEVGEFPSAYAPKPDEILPGTVGTTEISDNAITSPKIIAGAVIAGKVAASAISATELAAGSVIAGKIASATIVAGDIAASTITGAKIAGGTITGGNIAGSTITGGLIAATTILGSHIAAATIVGSNIAAATIAGSNVIADTLTAGTIAAAAIGTSELAAGSVVAGKVAAAAIGTTELAADSVVASKIAVDTIYAYHVVAGEITTAKINGLAVTTSKLADNSVTNRSMSTVVVDSGSSHVSSTENFHYATVVTEGGSVQVFGTIDRAIGDIYANVPSYDYWLYYVGTAGSFQIGAAKNSGDTSVGVAFSFSHAPPAGTQSYYVQVNRNTAGSPYDDDTYHFPVTLNVIEIKK